MTSGNSSFPRRLTKIDELTRPDHSFLAPEDECFYLGDYTARKGFAHSATNNLIINLKKPMDRRGTAQWPYKARAIEQAADALKNALSGTPLQSITFVPIPPSKAKSDAAYDDRMLQVLNRLGQGLDVREMVNLPTSMAAAHDSSERPRPDELAARYELVESACSPEPTMIILCDDVLTTGCHFRAMHRVLRARFPLVRICGIFLARRVPQPLEFEPVDLDS